MLRLCLVIGMLTGVLFTQTITIHGIVKDDEGLPLAGATIEIHEYQSGAISDAIGEFYLRNVKPGRVHLHIRYMGYHEQTLELNLPDNKDSLFVEIAMGRHDVETEVVVIESDPISHDIRLQPLPVLVVTQDFLYQHQTGSLMTTLEKLPGINSINVGVGISKPVIRGLSFNRVVVAELGVKQEGQQWGADHGIELDAFGVDRVEIIKGPGSVLYGSDAIGGVIHILPPVFPAPGKIQAQWSGLANSLNGTLGQSAMIAGNHQGWVFRFRFTTQDYGDYIVPADSFTYNRFVLPIINNRLKNTAGRERHFSIAAGAQRNWGATTFQYSRFWQQVGFFSGAFGIPTEYQIQDDGYPRNIGLPYQQIIHDKLINNTRINLGRAWLEMISGLQRNQRNERAVPHLHGNGPIPGSTDALGLVLLTASFSPRLHVRDPWGSEHVLGVSGSMQQNNISGWEYILPEFRTSAIGVFWMGQRTFFQERLTVTAGARWDWNHTLISGFSEPVWSSPTVISGYFTRTPDIDRTFWQPSASVGASWNHPFGWLVKMNAARSYRYPTPSELGSNGVHHGTFRHEQGYSGLVPEVGYQGDLSLGITRKTWKADFTPFGSWFSNYIYLRPTAFFSFLPEGGQIYRYSQCEALMWGSEGEFDFHPCEPLHLGLQGEYVHAQNLSSNRPISFIPPGSLLASMEYRKSELFTWVSSGYIRLEYQYVWGQYRVERNEPPTPSYNLVHVQAGWTWKFKKTPVDFYFQIQNLTDARYLKHLSRYRILNLPEPGRNIQLGISIRFEHG